MKTFAFAQKRASPSPRQRWPAVRPLGRQVRAQRAEIRNILHGPRVQAKLKVGAPDDAYEHEADGVADAVMRMPAPKASEEMPVSAREEDTAIQRKCAKCEEELRRQPIAEEKEEEELVQPKAVPGCAPEVTPDLASRIQALRGGGRPLPESARAFFEPRFGYDFSKVRVHADAPAVEAAKAVNARAFTVGRDVAFGAGQYTPETNAGRRLLAHELTHVVQQRNGSLAPTVRCWSYGSPGPHATGGGNTFGEITQDEREGSNGVDRAMAIVNRLVTGTDGRARHCQEWFDDNCVTPTPLVDLHNRAIIWMWRRADGSSGRGLSDGSNTQHHAVTEQSFNRRDRWELAATIVHEYWHDCEPGGADIGEQAVEACGLPT